MPKTRKRSIIKTIRKTDILAYLLRNIINIANISNEDYAIIAGYGLRNIREVTDLDVAVSKNAYEKLKTLDFLIEGTSKISNTPRLFIDLPFIEKDASIEFFELEKTGFPSDRYSLRNLQKNHDLILDKFQNPYINLPIVIELYSDVILKNNKLYAGEQYEIPVNRLDKNISHLQTLLKNQRYHHKIINKKLEYLTNLRRNL